MGENYKSQDAPKTGQTRVLRVSLNLVKNVKPSANMRLTKFQLMLVYWQKFYASYYTK